MKFEIAPKSTEVKLINCDDARLYCFSLNIDGKIGWRLPNKEELDEIYESENDFENGWYCSSTVFGGYSVWSQNFANGTQNNFQNFGGFYYVRAIRTTI